MSRALALGPRRAGLCISRRQVRLHTGPRSLCAAHHDLTAAGTGLEEINKGRVLYSLRTRHWGINGQEQKVEGEKERMQMWKAPFTEEHSHLLNTAFIATTGWTVPGEGKSHRTGVCGSRGPMRCPCQSGF